MATDKLGLQNDAAAGQKIRSSEWNLLAEAVESTHLNLAEVMGEGFLAATDFNVSANGTSKTVPVSAGHAVIGPEGGRVAVRVADVQNVLLVGTTTSPQTNYGYINQDGTCTVVQNPMNAPADSLLAWTCTCTDSGASSINNLPDGRVNLLGISGVRVSSADKQAGYLFPKFSAGTGISINIINDGENELIEITATGGGGGGGGLTAPVADSDLAEDYLKADGTRAATDDLDLGNNRIINMNYPTGALHGVNLTYLQTYYLPLVGGTVSGTISCATAPTSGNHLVNKTYADSLISTAYLRVDGTYAMAADLQMGSHKITGLATPTASDHGANKGYVDAGDAARLKLDGTTAMTGAFNMGTYRITNLGDPVSAQDGATKLWTETLIKAGTGQPIFWAVDAEGPFDSSEVLSRFCCSQSVIFGGTMTTGKSFARCWALPTSSATCKIYRRTSAGSRTEIGTVVFGTSSNTGTISFPTPITFAAGDCIEFDAPSSADATLGNLAVTIAGELA